MASKTLALYSQVYRLGWLPGLAGRGGVLGHSAKVYGLGWQVWQVWQAGMAWLTGDLVPGVSHARLAGSSGKQWFGGLLVYNWKS